MLPHFRKTIVNSLQHNSNHHLWWSCRFNIFDNRLLAKKSLSHTWDWRNAFCNNNNIWFWMSKSKKKLDLRNQYGVSVMHFDITSTEFFPYFCDTVRWMRIRRQQQSQFFLKNERNQWISNNKNKKIDDKTFAQQVLRIHNSFMV